MSVIFPAPLLSLSLFTVWLALARSASPGNLVFAAIIALAIPLLTARLRPMRVQVRRPWVVVRFIVTVCLDVVRSSFDVAWGVIRWGRKKPDSRFVVIPLELHDPVGLAALAIVTTVVPGTVWSELAFDRTAMLLHVWDVGDEEVFVARFKARYEKPLKEIFE